ncbi:hypothetical protein QJQ45_010692 [Haematococcus lacustris]|nr:hypothetical protein QJQ45_010692 [Haematococcus lacustris]
MNLSDTVDVEEQLQGLQGLPVELLDAVLRQLDASSRLQVFRTSKFLATAVLRRSPRIQLTYPIQHDILGQHLRELAPFLTEVLRNRKQPKLHLTLRPEDGLVFGIASCHTDAIWQRHRAEPAAAAADATRMVARMLGAVPLCGAVDCLAIGWCTYLDLPWEPVFSAALAASFPSLTSLTFKDVWMSIGNLATAINHPLLLPRLLHLDLQSARIAEKGQLGLSPFSSSSLQELRLDGWVTIGLLPLPPTLTHLAVTGVCDVAYSDWVKLAAAVESLTQLEQLTLASEYSDYRMTGQGPTAMLLALAHLPSLHTLVVEDVVVDQLQLDDLLALTQITRLQVHSFSRLTSSRASAACSWRRLKMRQLDWVTAAYLPLHSLTHPMQLHELVKGYEMRRIDDLSKELLGSAEFNLCERNKAGLVLDEDLCLSKATVDMLTEQYLSHSRHTAQHLPHPTVANSSHSGGVGSSARQRGQQCGSAAAGGQALMQRLGRCVKVLRITVQGLSEACLSTANRQALAVLFPTADIRFVGKQQ